MWHLQVRSRNTCRSQEEPWGFTLEEARWFDSEVDQKSLEEIMSLGKWVGLASVKLFILSRHHTSVYSILMLFSTSCFAVLPYFSKCLILLGGGKSLPPSLNFCFWHFDILRYSQKSLSEGIWDEWLGKLQDSLPKLYHAESCYIRDFEQIWDH